MEGRAGQIGRSTWCLDLLRVVTFKFGYFVWIFGFLTTSSWDLTLSAEMFVTSPNNRAIYSAKSSEGHFVGVNFTALPIPNLLNPWAVVYHAGQRKIYWSDHGYAQIFRCNLDGSGTEIIVPSGLSAPIGVDIDDVRSRVYWVDSIYKRIESANLDGSDRTVVIDTELNYPHDIVVASSQGLLFWPDRGNITIVRANIDGSNRVTLVNSGMLVPTGVALDQGETRVYWCDYQLGSVESVDFEGADRTVHVSGRVAGYVIRPWHLAVHGVNDDVYFTDNVNLLVFGPDRNGQIGPLSPSGLFSPPFDICISPAAASDNNGPVIPTATAIVLVVVVIGLVI